MQCALCPECSQSRQDFSLIRGFFVKIFLYFAAERGGANAGNMIKYNVVCFACLGF